MGHARTCDAGEVPVRGGMCAAWSARGTSSSGTDIKEKSLFDGLSDGFEPRDTALSRRSADFLRGPETVPVWGGALPSRGGLDSRDCATSREPDARPRARARSARGATAGARGARQAEGLERKERPEPARASRALDVGRSIERPAPRGLSEGRSSQYPGHQVHRQGHRRKVASPVRSLSCRAHRLGLPRGTRSPVRASRPRAPHFAHARRPVHSRDACMARGHLPRDPCANRHSASLLC